ncbi:MAG: phosphoglycerate kinase [Candidatus Thermoplasmatota archaeon]|nr:phosphoglycerate kinase [Candidatus Thermoplasmatota archaeon]
MFFTLDDFDVKDKTVIVRVDINSPLDPETLEILDVTRIEACAPTIKELSDKGAKVVVLAHQGRPGEWDFVPLDRHAKAMSRVLGRDVKFVDDIFGQKAKETIKAMKQKDIIILGNVRGYKEETAKKSAEELSKCDMVRELNSVADYFVNDAFAASHRSQASLVGFPYVLPSMAGRLMEKELKTLSKVFESPERPSLFFFGGAKFDDAIEMIEKLKKRSIADHIALVGMAGEAFVAAKGVNFGRTMELLKGDFERARKLIDDSILLPIDFAYAKEGKRVEISVGDLPVDEIVYDIGQKSIELFKEYIRKAKTIVVSGPAGKFEDDLFMKGTKELFEAIADSDGFSLAGGGHTTAALEKLGLKERFSYVSTGGGALETFMLGEELPAVKALERSYEIFKE